jgi:hypothetical protein
MPELVRYDAMCRAIDACYRVDEIKKIRDQHLALQAVARVAQNFDAERKAAVIRIRAERKGGELLRRMRERGERDAGRGGDRRSPSARTRVIPNLADMGISYDQSSRWQQLSEVPQEEFEADMAAILAGEERPSTTRIIRELGTRRGEHADRSVLRRINGRVQSDLWTNRLPQLFGSEPSEITLDPGVDLFQRAQEFLRTDVAIIKHILAVSTLLPDERYWPGNNQPRKYFWLLRCIYGEEKVDDLLQHLSQMPDRHEEFLNQLLKDVKPEADRSEVLEGTCDVEA